MLGDGPEFSGHLLAEKPRQSAGSALEQLCELLDPLLGYPDTRTKDA